MRPHFECHPRLKLSCREVTRWWRIATESGRIANMELESSQDVDLLFDTQDAALKLLSKLRKKYFPTVLDVVQPTNQRRQYKRWSAPESISIDIYTNGWQPLSVIDVGIGGAKIARNEIVPTIGPFVCKLGVGDLTNVIILTDIMWMADQTVGIRFEFDNQDEHDLWAEHLVNTLLGKLSI